MKKLLYFNHDEVNLPILVPIKEAATKCGFEFDPVATDTTADDYFQKLQLASVAIVHGEKQVGANPAAYANYDWFCNDKCITAHELVVILVSSRAITTKNKIVQFKNVTGTQCMRFVLSVRDTKKSGLTGSSSGQAANLWIKVLIKCSRADLEPLFSKIGSKDSFPEFESLFEDETAPEFLIALSILCQGFLASFALNPENQKTVCFEDGTKSVYIETGNHSEVADALFDMGWVDDSNSAKIRDDVLTLGPSTDFPSPGMDFWTQPFESDDMLLSERIQRELPKNQKNLPVNLKTLVTAIEERNTSGLDVCLLARAYTELNQLLNSIGSK